MQDQEIQVPEDLAVTGTSGDSDPSALPATETGSDQGTGQPPQSETPESQEGQPPDPDSDGDHKDGLSKEERAAQKIEQRIGRVTREKWEAFRQRDDAARERDAIRAELEALRAQASPQDGQPQPQPLDPKLIEALADKRAEEKLQIRSFNENCDRAAESGDKEFSDFREATGTLAAMGALRPEVLNPVFDICKVIETEPHQLLYHLGKDPDEAARILRQPAHLIGAALTRFATKAIEKKTAPPVSKAPPPVKPVTGAAKVELDDSKLSDQEWFDKYERGKRA